MAKVTIRALKEMRADRDGGMTYQSIADKHGFCYSTVVYHLDEKQAEHWRGLWRARQARATETPEKRAAYNAYQLAQRAKRKLADVPGHS